MAVGAYGVEWAGADVSTFSGGFDCCCEAGGGGELGRALVTLTSLYPHTLCFPRNIRKRPRG